jgi:hypothetical protein
MPDNWERGPKLKETTAQKTCNQKYLLYFVQSKLNVLNCPSEVRQTRTEMRIDRDEVPLASTKISTGRRWIHTGSWLGS